jgi:putative ABC transport system substrate-binding protein
VTNRIALGLIFLVAVLKTPIATEAQLAERSTRVGWLDAWDAAYEWHAPLVRELEKLGYVTGRNLRFEVRKADYKAERLPQLAAELARLDVDVIVAMGDPAILAARQATTTIPIVMLGAVDPVGTGFVASLGRPGGNVTGVSDAAADVVAKQLQLLRDVAPQVSRVRLLRPPLDVGTEQLVMRTQAAARALGLALVSKEVRTRRDVEQAFGAIENVRATAFLVIDRHLLDIPSLNLIGQLALKRRVPVVSDSVKLTWEGGLLSYATSYAPQAQRAAQYVVRILKGAKPGDLPVEQPTTFDLAINLKTAKALGLTIPQPVLLRADQVIE